MNWTTEIVVATAIFRYQQCGNVKSIWPPDVVRSKFKIVSHDDTSCFFAKDTGILPIVINNPFRDNFFCPSILPGHFHFNCAGLKVSNGFFSTGKSEVFIAYIHLRIKGNLPSTAQSVRVFGRS